MQQEGGQITKNLIIGCTDGHLRILGITSADDATISMCVSTCVYEHKVSGSSKSSGAFFLSKQISQGNSPFHFYIRILLFYRPHFES